MSKEKKKNELIGRTFSGLRVKVVVNDGVSKSLPFLGQRRGRRVGDEVIFLQQLDRSELEREDSFAKIALEGDGTVVAVVTTRAKHPTLLREDLTTRRPTKVAKPLDNRLELTEKRIKSPRPCHLKIK